MRTFFCNTLFVIGLLLILSSCANHKKPENKDLEQYNSPEKKSAGKIVFVKEIHNFGTLKDGEIVSFSFVFRNMGGSPIQIVKTEVSCGCINIQYDRNDILPGESSDIEVVFNTSGEWGNILKGVTIETSDGARKELQIGAYIENKQFNNLLNTQK